MNNHFQNIVSSHRLMILNLQRKIVKRFFSFCTIEFHTQDKVNIIDKGHKIDFFLILQ